MIFKNKQINSINNISNNNNNNNHNNHNINNHNNNNDNNNYGLLIHTILTNQSNELSSAASSYSM